MFIKQGINYSSDIKHVSEMNLLELKFVFSQDTASYRPLANNMELYISEMELCLLNLTKVDHMLFMLDLDIII